MKLRKIRQILKIKNQKTETENQKILEIRNHIFEVKNPLGLIVQAMD